MVLSYHLFLPVEIGATITSEVDTQLIDLNLGVR